MNPLPSHSDPANRPILLDFEEGVELSEAWRIFLTEIRQLAADCRQRRAVRRLETSTAADNGETSDQGATQTDSAR